MLISYINMDIFFYDNVKYVSNRRKKTDPETGMPTVWIPRNGHRRSTRSTQYFLFTVSSALSAALLLPVPARSMIC